MKRLNRPLVTQETIKAMEDMSFFTHAMIFDDLLIIAQRETSCFVLWTTDGLIIIDAIWPARPAFDAIVNAISDAGWGGCPVKKLLLTHGHVDHTGCGRWLRSPSKSASIANSCWSESFCPLGLKNLMPLSS